MVNTHLVVKGMIVFLDDEYLEIVYVVFIVVIVVSVVIATHFNFYIGEEVRPVSTQL